MDRIWSFVGSVVMWTGVIVYAIYTYNTGDWTMSNMRQNGILGMNAQPAQTQVAKTAPMTVAPPKTFTPNERQTSALNQTTGIFKRASSQFNLYKVEFDPNGVMIVDFAYAALSQYDKSGRESTSHLYRIGEIVSQKVGYSKMKFRLFRYGEHQVPMMEVKVY